MTRSLYHWEKVRNQKKSFKIIDDKRYVVWFGRYSFPTNEWETVKNISTTYPQVRFKKFTNLTMDEMVRVLSYYPCKTYNEFKELAIEKKRKFITIPQTKEENKAF